MFEELFDNQLEHEHENQHWEVVAASPAWPYMVKENRTEAMRLFQLLSLCPAFTFLAFEN